MNGWRSVTVGELCDRVTVGHVGKMADEYVDTGVPFLRSQDIKPFTIREEGLLRIGPDFHRRLSKSVLRAGDVVVVRTGYPGTAAVVPARLDGANCADLVIMTPSNELNPHVLAGVFNSRWGREAVGCNLVGSAQQHFNVGSAKTLRIHLPDRRTQDGIAHVLCTLHDLLENNRRRIELLEQVAQTIYREWFVHFRYPLHEDDELIESPVGPIPTGWRAGKLDDLLILQRGFDLPSAKRVEGAVPIITASGHHGYHDEPRVIGPGVATGRSGTVGAVFYVWQDFWPLNTTLWVKEYRRSSPCTAYFMLRDLGLAQYASGVAVPTLNRNHIHGLPLPVPPERLVMQFDKVAVPIKQLQETLRRKCERLDKVRELLLPKLVTGQIDLSKLHLDAVLEEAVG